METRKSLIYLSAIIALSTTGGVIAANHKTNNSSNGSTGTSGTNNSNTQREIESHSQSQGRVKSGFSTHNSNRQSTVASQLSKENVNSTIKTSQKSVTAADFNVIKASKNLNISQNNIYNQRTWKQRTQNHRKFIFNLMVLNNAKRHLTNAQFGLANLSQQAENVRSQKANIQALTSELKHQNDSGNKVWIQQNLRLTRHQLKHSQIILANLIKGARTNNKYNIILAKINRDAERNQPLKVDRDLYSGLNGIQVVNQKIVNDIKRLQKHDTKKNRQMLYHDERELNRRLVVSN